MAYTNIINNGGAPNTTDWINPTGGLAEFWSAVAQTKSIVTGNGFIGDAQRIETIVSGTGTHYHAIHQLDTDFLSASPTTGGYGNLSFKYRSSNPELSYFSIWANVNGTYGLIGTFPNNTGNAVSISFSFDWSSGPLQSIVFGRWNTTPSMPNGTYYLELDEVTVIADSSPLLLPKIQVGAAWKDIKFTGSKIMVGGVWKTISGVQLRTGGAWETIY